MIEGAVDNERRVVGRKWVGPESEKCVQDFCNFCWLWSLVALFKECKFQV